MFENDDWNIDDDYLKDFNADEIITDFENANKSKTQRSLLQQNPELEEKLSTNLSNTEFNCSNFETRKCDTETKYASKSEENAAFNIFNSMDNAQKDSKLSQRNILKSRTLFDSTKQIYIPNLNIRNDGKKLVLDLFRNNEINITKNNILTSTCFVTSMLKGTGTNEESAIENENKLKRKKNVAFLEFMNETAFKKNCYSTMNQLSEQTTSNSSKLQSTDNRLASTSLESNTINDAKVNICKEQVLVELLKPQVYKNLKIPQMKQTVIRKFPGPAGLLIDDFEESNVIDLNSEDGNKNKCKKYNNLCSQNTKNLFTTGAWQLMIDDLPIDFELYDIASVKARASQLSKSYKKVPFLAGIIQCIDYKPNDPHVILKDLSGKIDALIHHSIYKLYPSALGIGTVVLVKDVGLIVTSKKYVCLIISPKNLVSIYSEDTRLVKTLLLEKVFHNNHNYYSYDSEISINETEDHIIKMNQSREFNHCNPSKLLINTELSFKKKTIIDSSLSDCNNLKKSVNATDYLSKKLNTANLCNIINHVNNAHNFDFNQDDFLLGANIGEFNYFNAHQVPSSTQISNSDKNLNH